MIPKIIHYCWFGGEIPKENKKYIEEWQQLNPDWTIILWNEDNSPRESVYLKVALQHNNWANASNFIRLFALLNFGGIYLDTDIKVIKSFGELIDNDCFFGFEEGEDGRNDFWVNNAICGAIKNHTFIEDCYNHLIQNFDGTEEANLSGPRLVTALLKEKKNLAKYGYQKIDDITLYPKEYFYPIHYSEVYKIKELEKHIYPETIVVHVWARTWLSKEDLLSIIDELYYQNKILSEEEKKAEHYGNKNGFILVKIKELETKIAQLNSFIESNQLLLLSVNEIKDKLSCEIIKERNNAEKLKDILSKELADKDKYEQSFLEVTSLLKKEKQNVNEMRGYIDELEKQNNFLRYKLESNIEEINIARSNNEDLLSKIEEYKNLIHKNSFWTIIKKKYFHTRNTSTKP